MMILTICFVIISFYIIFKSHYISLTQARIFHKCHKSTMFRFSRVAVVRSQRFLPQKRNVQTCPGSRLPMAEMDRSWSVLGGVGKDLHINISLGIQWIKSLESWKKFTNRASLGAIFPSGTIHPRFTCIYPRESSHQRKRIPFDGLILNAWTGFSQEILPTNLCFPETVILPSTNLSERKF